jgi:hypothetical protein
MDVIHVPPIIVFVSNNMLPITPLPQATLGAAGTARADALTGRDLAGKTRLDQAPASREIVIIRRQTPQTVQMIRQHDNGLDGNRMIGERLPKRGPQGRDITDQQIVTLPLGQRQGEEIGAAGDFDALVGSHGVQRAADAGVPGQRPTEGLTGVGAVRARAFQGAGVRVYRAAALGGPSFRYPGPAYLTGNTLPTVTQRGSVEMLPGGSYVVCKNSP